MSNATEPSAAAKVDAQNGVSFDDMQLPVGARLQLLLGSPVQQFATRLVGYVADEYLIVRIPVVNGLPVQINEGTAMTVRVLTGVSLFAFKTHVARALRNDLHLLLLDYPERVQQTTFRSTPRVKIQLTAEAIPKAGASPGTATTVTVIDLSATGAKVQAETELGGKEDEVDLTLKFQLKLSDDEICLKLSSKIRSVGDKNTAGHHVFGLQFSSPKNEDKLYLQNLVYERMLEDRQATA